MTKTTLELDTKLHKTVKNKCCLHISLSYRLNVLFLSYFHPLSFLLLTPLVVPRKAGVAHKAVVVHTVGVAHTVGVVRRAGVVHTVGVVRRPEVVHRWQLWQLLLSCSGCTQLRAIVVSSLK